MKNFDPIDINENELDQLLRQFVLDGGDDEFTQNTLNMNADFLFGTTEKIAPDATRELAMIQQLEKVFVGPKRRGKFWLNGILLLLLCSVGVWFYQTYSGNVQPLSQNVSGGNNTSPTFLPSGDTSVSNSTSSPAISISQNSSTTLANDSLTTVDTSQTQTASTQHEHFTHTNDHIPLERNWFAGSDAVPSEDVPGPVFSAKASPENYKAAQAVFIVDTALFMATMFKCKQDSFTATYYTGEPFKSGMSDMQYFNFGDFAHSNPVISKFPNKFKWQLPWSVLEYADTNEVKVETEHFVINNQTRDFTSIMLHKIPQRGIELMMEPFYFRKYEVTNKEYREFVNWVRKANGFENKPICKIDIDTLEVTDPNDKNGEQITKKGKRYRIVQKSHQIEDYKEVYNYVFFNQGSDAVKTLAQKSIYVLPDTLSWVNDFTFSYNEPMTNMYFWHPAYDNYPVVGVSWYQAMAFLDWKTHMHQKQLDAEKVPYEIEYTLPSDIEWELVSISTTIGKAEKDAAFWYTDECTDDWLTNLGLNYPGHDDPYQRPNYLKNLFTKDQYSRGNFIEDGYFHTGVADLSHNNDLDKTWGTRHYDQLGISWMDGNVSEWMAENYSDNWKPFFRKHLAVLDADNSESSNLAKQIELLYDKGNAANGKLVRGANWYDERFSGKPSITNRNDAGINPKRFVDPSEQHCTLGFRYVVHVKKK